MERRAEDRDYWNKQFHKRGLAAENEENHKVVQSNFTVCVYWRVQYVCVGHCERVNFYL